MSLFNPSLGVERSALTVSNTITANFGPNTTVTISGGVLLKNGVQVTSPAIVNDGDTLALRITSSANYLTTVSSVLTVGTLSYAFQVITKQAPATIPYVPFVDVLPLDLPTQQDGTAYVPNTASAHINKFQSAAPGTITTTIGIPLSSGNVSTTVDQVAVINHFSNSVSFVNTTTNAVVGTIATGIKPYAMCVTPVERSNDPRSSVWVTISGADQVVRIEPTTHTIFQTFATGTQPMGIAASYNGAHVWVANHGSSNVTHFAINPATGAWTQSNVTIGVNPFGVAVDFTGNAWVTCSTTNKLYRVTKAGVATAFNIGNSPREIILDKTGKWLWVVCSKDNTIQQISVSNGGVAQTISNVGQLPYSITQASDSNLYVSAIVPSTVTKIPGTGVVTTVTSTANTDVMAYSLASDTSGGVWSANYYDNTPSYVVPSDQTPDAFAFTPLLGLDPDTPQVTNIVTLTGLPVAALISVPSIYQATVFINGVVASPGATVITGKTVQIKYHTPTNSFGKTIEIPVAIGGNIYPVTASMRAASSGPDPVTFNLVKVTGPITNQESSNAVISGLGPGVTCVIKPDRLTDWGVRVNGVLHTDLTIPIVVQDGDVFSLVGICDLSAAAADDYLVDIQAKVNGVFVSFGTFAMQVPVLLGCIKWVHTFDYATRTSALPIGLAIAGNIYKTTEDRLPVVMVKNSLHISEVDSGYMTQRKSLVTSGEAAMFMVDVSRHDIFGEMSTPVRNLAPTRKESADPTYIDAQRQSVVKAPAPNYERNVPLVIYQNTAATMYVTNAKFALHTIVPAVERNIRYTLRTAVPAYVKNTSFALRAYTPVSRRNDRFTLRTIEPAVERNTRYTLRTIEPVMERNVRYTLVTTGPYYIKPFVENRTSIDPVYVQQPPVYKYLDNTLGPEDYVPRTIYAVRTVDMGNYVKIGAREVTAEVGMNYMVRPYNPVLIAGMQPLKVYVVHNDEYTDTPEQIGDYASEVEAEQAGTDAGFDPVVAVQLPDGNWMYDAIQVIPPTDCDGNLPPEPPSGLTRPYKWYVHGG